VQTVKRAILTARIQKRYEVIINDIIVIAFIGTPHRGAHLASILKSLLNVSFSDTKFVADLSPSSRAIKEIYDTFCEGTEGFKMVSFWESIGMQGFGVKCYYIYLTLTIIPSGNWPQLLEFPKLEKV